MLGLMLLVGLLAPHAQAEGTDDPVKRNRDQSVVRLGAIPEVKLQRRVEASVDEIGEIKRCISELAKINAPDVGLSPTMSGSAFLPIKGMSDFGGFLITNHRLESSTALRRLVELGPKALPHLLNALDDHTATGLQIKHSGFDGAMWFANELGTVSSNEVWSNPVNERERRVLGKLPLPSDLGDTTQRVDSYTVKVSDVCFVAIGQIVGRSYQAVRYQPSGCIVLNSLTHDPGMRQQVRAIWSSDDPAQVLLESLLSDYATTGDSVVDGVDGRGLASDLQVSAVLRLLYYFPREATQLIAQRLDDLDVSYKGPGRASPGTPEQFVAWRRQYAANGVRADDFVKAVAWCDEPEIKEAMSRLFQRATDPDVITASSRSVGVDHPELVCKRIAKMIDDLPETEGGPYGDGYNLLLTLGRCGGEEAKSTFEKYLENRTKQRCWTICCVLREVRGEWAIDLLAPLLKDRRATGFGIHPVNSSSPDAPTAAIRVCDAAAETISRANETLPFSMIGTRPELDRQIKLIRERIADVR